MTIHLYTICWNERDMLGFFFRHYDPWVDRYIIYDDGSDDGSLDLMRRHPKVEVRRFARVNPDSFVLSHREMHNEAWKESRGLADWVIVTAIDEHLELAGGGDQRAYLQECRSAGVTLVPAIGYQMIRRQFPDPAWRLASKVTTGAPYDVMSKLSIFDPNAIVSPGFGVGRHRAQPEGKVRYPAHDRMMLLHYKYLGFVTAYRRQRALAQGLGTTDIQNRWGRQYLRGPFNHLRTWWNFERKAVDVGRPGFDPSSPPGHKGRIWWRT
jgi:hypothetical protein